MALKNKIGFVIQIPFEEKFWLAACFLGSIISWFVIRLISMKRLASAMGYYIENREICMLATTAQIEKAQRIGYLMEKISLNVPWESKCLSEALCVKWLLNRLRIPSVFYLGALIEKNDQQDKMKAHAWVNVAAITIIGSETHTNYIPIASFITPSSGKDSQRKPTTSKKNLEK